MSSLRISFPRSGPTNPKRVVPGAKRADVWAEYEAVSHGLLGTGVSSVVRSVVRRGDRALFALKIIDKAVVDDLSQIANEVRLLRKIAGDSRAPHSQIVRLYDVYESDAHVSLVMEHCAGGELLDKVRRMGTMREADVAVVAAQLLAAIAYLHSRHIVHRDIKPENIVFADSHSLSLRLVDLGLAKALAGEGTRTPCGTPAFLAPELMSVQLDEGVQDAYDHRIDVWAAGCVIYTLLGGAPPFAPAGQSSSYGDFDAQLESIRAGGLSFAAAPWDAVSPEAKDLISGMLRVDPSARLSADQALAHPWFGAMSVETAAPPASGSMSPTQLDAALAVLCSPADSGSTST